MFVTKNIIALMELWHKQFGHLNYKSPLFLSNHNGMNGISKLPIISHDHFYKSYMVGKKLKKRFPRLATHK
jgi:hypothetical protein